MDSDRIIDALGGTNKVAEICDLTAGAISQWRNNGIPPGWLAYLKSAYPKVFSGQKEKAA
jgi:hypothetical protein